jgi:hypothetical protein
VESEHPTEADALKANDAVLHLRHHGINAVKYRASGEDDEIAGALIEECHRLDANLLGNGQLRALASASIVAGSTTDRILRRSLNPVRRGLSVPSLALRITGSPTFAFAGDDGWECGAFVTSRNDCFVGSGNDAAAFRGVGNGRACHPSGAAFDP